MAQLTVRNLDPEIVRRLRIRAAENGRSAEAEHRLILEETLKPAGDDFWDKAAALRQRLKHRSLENGTAILRKRRRGGSARPR